MALQTVALFCVVMLSIVTAQSTQDDDSEEAHKACDASILERAMQRLQSDIDELKRVLTVHSSATGK